MPKIFVPSEEQPIMKKLEHIGYWESPSRAHEYIKKEGITEAIYQCGSRQYKIVDLGDAFKIRYEPDSDDESRWTHYIGLEAGAKAADEVIARNKGAFEKLAKL